MSPGDTWGFTFRYMDLPESQNSLTFQPVAVIDETSLGNNTQTCPVPVHTLPAPIPVYLDLIVSQLMVEPASGPPSTNFAVSVTVKNVGPDDLERPSMASVICTIPDKGWNLGGLAVGESKTFTFQVTNSLPPGNKTTTCTISGVSGETDRDNNSRSASFVVTQPDDD